MPDAVGVTAPGNWLRALELRAIPEYLVAQLSRDVIARWPHGDGHPVLVLPGFWPVRDQLSSCAARCASWDITLTTGASVSTWGTGPA
ncbi:hypothetical protein A5655_09290 [Mycobacterium sp. 1081908.1]|nr:hypothetical protein A5655_09290 [Mycobacterium sp. 1081908.1]